MEPDEIPPEESGAPAAEGPRIPAGTLIEERYRVLHRMDVGGFGEIYRVRDIVLERDLVLKIPRPELARVEAFRHAFLREARLAMELRSPGTAAIRDAGQVGSLPYFTMDLVPGEDLRFLLRREGRLAPERAIRLAIGVLRILAKAHDLGVVHRDLKPANIMVLPVAEEGVERVVLLDFGIARILSSAGGVGGGAKGTLCHGRLVGSPRYMSPEHAAGDPVDARSDLYAMGVLIFEMITGRPPFDAPTSGQILMQQMVAEAPSMGAVAAEIPPLPRLEQAVARALAKDPSARFEDAASFARELEAILAQRCESSREMPPQEAALEEDLAGLALVPSAERLLPQRSPSRLEHARSRARRRYRRRVLAARLAFLAILGGGAGTILFPAVWADIQAGWRAIETDRGPGAAEFYLNMGTRSFVRGSTLEVRGKLISGCDGGVIIECEGRRYEPGPGGEFQLAVAVDSARPRRVLIRARATSGESFSRVLEVRRDVDPPGIHIAAPLPLLTRSARFEVRVEIDDLAPALVEIYPEGNEERSFALDGQPGFGRTMYSGVAESEHEGRSDFIVRAVDRAGNASTARLEVFFDRSPPEIDRTVPSRDGLRVTSARLRVELKVWDLAGSGVGAVFIDGQRAEAQGEHTWAANLNLHDEMAAPGKVTRRTITCSASDRAGNLSPPCRFDVLVDRTSAGKKVR